MNRKVLGVLVILTVFQATMSLITYWPSDATQSIYRPVVAFRPTEIMAIDISDPEQMQRTPKPLSLTRTATGEWAVASMDGFPARADRIQTLLNRLSSLKVQTPISSDSGKHDTLGVGQDRYGKKIRLATDTASVTFFVGQGKGNSIHIRIDGSDDVYLTHGITAWKISAAHDDYIERIFFEFQPPTLVGLTVRSPADAYQLKLENGQFSSPDLPPSQRLKQDTLTHTINKVSRLVTRQALGVSSPMGFAPNEVTTVTFQLKDPNRGIYERTLSIGRPQGALIPIKQSNSPFYALVQRFWRESTSEQRTRQLYCRRALSTSLF